MATIARQPSSTISSQGTEGTCFAHTVARVFSRLLKLKFPQYFIIQNEKCSHYYNSVDCDNIFECFTNEQDKSRMYTDPRCTDQLDRNGWIKENISALLYTYIYKLVTNEFGCNRGGAARSFAFVITKFSNGKRIKYADVINTLIPYNLDYIDNSYYYDYFTKLINKFVDIINDIKIRAKDDDIVLVADNKIDKKNVHKMELSNALRFGLYAYLSISDYTHNSFGSHAVTMTGIEDDRDSYKLVLKNSWGEETVDWISDRNVKIINNNRVVLNDLPPYVELYCSYVYFESDKRTIDFYSSIVFALSNGNDSEVANAIISLIRLSRSGNMSDNEYASAALRILSDNNADSDTKSITAGAIPYLIKMVQSGVQRKNEKNLAAAALGILAKSYANQKTTVEEGAIPLLITLAKTGNPDENAMAAFALSALANYKENHITITNAGAIPLLTQLANSGNEMGKTWAVAALKLLPNPATEVRKRVIRNEPPIRNTSRVNAPLPSPPQPTIRNTPRVNAPLPNPPQPRIFNIYNTPRVNAPSTEPIPMDIEPTYSRVIPPPPKLVQPPYPDVNPPQPKLIPMNVEPTPVPEPVPLSTADKIRALINQAETGSLEDKDNAAKTLGDLASNNYEIIMDIVEYNGVSALVDIVNNGNPTAKANAAKALWNMTFDPNDHVDDYTDVTDTLKEIVQHRGVEALVNLAKNGNDIGKEMAAGALGGMSSTKEISRYIVETEGAIPALFDLAKSTIVNVKMNAMLALAGLAKYDENNIAIAAAGGIPMLVDLLKSRNPKVQDNAAEVLLNMIKNVDLLKTISDAITVNGLTILAKSNNPKVIEIATSALLNRSTNDNDLYDISKIAIPVLIKLADLGNENALGVLVKLSVNYKNDIAQTDGAIPVLIKLARSDNVKVNDMAIETLQYMSRNDDIKASIVNAGYAINGGKTRKSKKSKKTKKYGKMKTKKGRK